MTQPIRVSHAVAILALGHTALYGAVVGSGVMSTTGTAPGFWEWNSLVYAEAKAEGSVPGGPRLLTVHVIATLRGRLDPVESTPLVAKADWIPTSLSREGQRPHKLVLLLRRDARGEFLVPSDRFLFMPDREGILEVESMEDTKAQEVLQALSVLHHIKHDRFTRVLEQFNDQMRKTGSKP